MLRDDSLKDLNYKVSLSFDGRCWLDALSCPDVANVDGLAYERTPSGADTVISPTRLLKNMRFRDGQSALCNRTAQIVSAHLHNTNLFALGLPGTLSRPRHFL